MDFPTTTCGDQDTDGHPRHVVSARAAPHGDKHAAPPPCESSVRVRPMRRIPILSPVPNDTANSSRSSSISDEDNSGYTSLCSSSSSSFCSSMYSDGAEGSCGEFPDDGIGLNRVCRDDGGGSSSGVIDAYSVTRLARLCANETAARRALGRRVRRTRHRLRLQFRLGVAALVRQSDASHTRRVMPMPLLLLLPNAAATARDDGSCLRANNQKGWGVRCHAPGGRASATDEALLRVDDSFPCAHGPTEEPVTTQNVRVMSHSCAQSSRDGPCWIMDEGAGVQDAPSWVSYDIHRGTVHTAHLCVDSVEHIRHQQQQQRRRRRIWSAEARARICGTLDEAHARAELYECFTAPLAERNEVHEPPAPHGSASLQRLPSRQTTHAPCGDRASEEGRREGDDAATAAGGVSLTHGGGTHAGRSVSAPHTLGAHGCETTAHTEESGCTNRATRDGASLSSLNSFSNGAGNAMRAANAQSVRGEITPRQACGSHSAECDGSEEHTGLAVACIDTRVAPHWPETDVTTARACGQQPLHPCMSAIRAGNDTVEAKRTEANRVSCPCTTTARWSLAYGIRSVAHPPAQPVSNSCEQTRLTIQQSSSSCSSVLSLCSSVSAWSERSHPSRHTTSRAQAASASHTTTARTVLVHPVAARATTRARFQPPTRCGTEGYASLAASSALARRTARTSLGGDCTGCNGMRTVRSAFTNPSSLSSAVPPTQRERHGSSVCGRAKSGSFLQPAARTPARGAPLTRPAAAASPAMKPHARRTAPLVALARDSNPVYVSPIACTPAAGGRIRSYFVNACGTWESEELRRRCQEESDRALARALAVYAISSVTQTTAPVCEPTRCMDGYGEDLFVE